MKIKQIKLKSLLVLAVVGAVVFSSCSKEDALSEKESLEADVDSRLAKITITAFNGEEEPASKTVLAGDELKQVHWIGNEEIAVFYYQTLNKFTSNGAEKRATATFNGTIAGISDPSQLNGEEVIGLYPYNANATISADGTISTTLPDVQEAVPNSFASNLMIAMGKSTSNATKMKFFNVCGGLCFTVQHEDIKQVVLTAKGGEPIAGDFTVKFATNDEGKEVPMVQNVSNGKSSITINAPNGGVFDPKDTYYIVTLPTELKQGIIIEAVRENGNGYLTEITSKSETSLEFKRAVFGRKKEIEKDAHEYVDLGLEVKWAATNVGAAQPADYGDYFAWGETEPKTDYSWETYKWGPMDAITKYNASDGRGQLLLEDDAANKIWGSDWSMPSEKDYEELLDLDKKAGYMKNSSGDDVYGYYFYEKGKSSSDPEANYIFFPATGYRTGIITYLAGEYGDYWSSSLFFNGSQAYYFFFHAEQVYGADLDRCQGRAVRPILKRK